MKINWTDWIIAISTVAMTLATLAIAYLALQTGKQTDRLISAANSIACSLEQSLAQSQKSLDATITQNQLDQRAWVGVTAISMDIPELTLNSYPSFHILVINSGRTPALKVSLTNNIHSYLSTDTFKPVYDKKFATPSVSVIQPGAATVAPSNPTSTPITQPFLDIIKSGGGSMYIYGKITYEDIFHNVHHTTFCSFVAQDAKSIHTCPTYNTAD